MTDQLLVSDFAAYFVNKKKYLTITYDFINKTFVVFVQFLLLIMYDVTSYWSCGIRCYRAVKCFGMDQMNV